MGKEQRNPVFGEKELKDVLGFKPIEKLGQSFLVDPEKVRQFVATVVSGADVVEVGSGPGNLTMGISKIAQRVTGLEIFPGYAEAQARTLGGCANVKILTTSALKFDFRRWVDADRDAQHQVVGNLPFHISEPLLTTLAQVSDHLDDITLMVGDSLAGALCATNPRDSRYTRLSFIASIFDVSRVSHVPRKSCWPVPRTDSDIVSLVPKESPKDGSMLAHQLRRRIVLSQPQNLTLIKVINGFSTNQEDGKNVDKKASNRHDRQQTREELRWYTMPMIRKDVPSDRVKMSRLSDRLGLPSEILSKPFSRLNNQEVRRLAEAIENL